MVLADGRRREDAMKPAAFMLAAVLGLAVVSAPALAADDSRVKDATRQVEDGAKKIGKGEVGDGVKETAKSVGETVAEGAKYTGEKIKESGRAAEPEARSAWNYTREGAIAFGRSVRDFFASLFSR
jgi:hypothetical protein